MVGSITRAHAIWHLSCHLEPSSVPWHCRRYATMCLATSSNDKSGLEVFPSHSPWTRNHGLIYEIKPLALAPTRYSGSRELHGTICFSASLLRWAKIIIQVCSASFSSPLSLLSIAMVRTALLILALAAELHAAPIPALSALNASSFAQSSPSHSACNDIHGCRTLWSVIYGCIITIFSCTYLSFHPDVPDASHTVWRIRVVHACAVFFGFLIPELVVAKAAVRWWEVWENDAPFQGTPWNGV